jgi:putative Mg2+ transporter-C (MgtC) family protein
MLICVGSTVITMASVYLALAFSERQTAVGDPGRIAGEMISGIGFLGAGVIIQARGSVHGLTTAATIWYMAGVGLTIGSGMYELAIAATVILLVVLWVLGRIENRLTKPRRFVHFLVSARREAGVLDEINDIAEENNLELDDFRLSRGDDGMEVEFALTCSVEARDDFVERMLEIEAIESVQVGE